VQRRPERADATRNRQSILRAAEELLNSHGPEHISMEQVAIAAGVSKGTVFHRFGSRVGLLHALMEERAAALEEAVAAGPPPLGPGAPASERLVAFLDALIELASRNVGLIAAHDHAVASKDGSPRQTHPLYQLWHRHLAALIEEDRPDLDSETLAHVLLGCLHSDLIAFMIRSGDLGRLTAALHEVASGVLGGPRGGQGSAG